MERKKVFKHSSSYYRRVKYYLKQQQTTAATKKSRTCENNVETAYLKSKTQLNYGDHSPLSPLSSTLNSSFKSDQCESYVLESISDQDESEDDLKNLINDEELFHEKYIWLFRMIHTHTHARTQNI